MIIRAIAMMAGIFLTIGILTIAIFVAGAILGIVLSVLVPVGLLFTGAGLMWFLATDFSTEKPKAKQ